MNRRPGDDGEFDSSASSTPEPDWAVADILGSLGNAIRLRRGPDVLLWATTPNGRGLTVGLQNPWTGPTEIAVKVGKPSDDRDFLLGTLAPREVGLLILPTTPAASPELTLTIGGVTAKTSQLARSREPVEIEFTKTLIASVVGLGQLLAFGAGHFAVYKQNAEVDPPLKWSVMISDPGGPTIDAVRFLPLWPDADPQSSFRLWRPTETQPEHVSRRWWRPRRHGAAPLLSGVVGRQVIVLDSKTGDPVSDL